MGSMGKAEGRLLCRSSAISLAGARIKGPWLFTEAWSASHLWDAKNAAVIDGGAGGEGA